MSRTSIPNISDTIVEIGKRLQGLKAHKETLDEEIDMQIDLRDMLTAKLNAAMDELERINESIEQKKTVLNVYNKILNESDSAYSKIVKSTEALYKMVYNEEKKITKSNY